MTEQQAIALYDSKWWESRSAFDIVSFQLFEERLCMPFGDFHKAVEEVLGRPVWTHEFGILGAAQLKREFLKERPAPTLDEILAIIPENKRIVIGL